MFSAWHLLWICPLCCILGVFSTAVLAANNEPDYKDDWK